MISKYQSENIRNIAVVGHSNTGKTALVENLLFFNNAISEEQLGKVCDFDSEEKIKGFSIHNTLVFLEFEDVKINLIDTPGISDFVADVFPALRASEGALVVIDSEFGIQVETEKIWHYADEYNIPRIVFINKMDKPESDFFKIIDDLSTRFHTPIFPLEIPIGKGSDFEGVIDLVLKKAVYPDPNHHEVTYKAIPEDYLGIVEKYYDNLKAVIAETSEELEMKYLEGEELTQDEVIQGLRECIKRFKIVPVMCGSALKCIGLKTLLNLIKNEMPSPSFIPEVIGYDPSDENESLVRKCSENEAFSGLVFKTRLDQYTGKQSFFKATSGKLKTGDSVLVANKNKKEKIFHLYNAIGEKLIEVPQIVAGDIGILAKTEFLHTGDTLTALEGPMVLPPMRIPKPIFFQSIHHDDKKMEEKIIEELHKCELEDPSFKVEFDTTTLEHLIKGMGDLHLSLTLDKIEQKLKTKIITREPSIPYKETISNKTIAKYKHKKQSGGHGQYGEVHIEIEPLPRSAGFEFVNNIVGGRIPKQYIPGVEKGLLEAMQKGVLAGYPVEDIRVSLFDGTFHSVDSSELAFKIAASSALKQGLQAGRSVLLEPIMKVQIHAEREIMGDIMNDLTSRRGRVLEMNQDENTDVDHPTQVILAHVPMKDMLSYALELKSISKGKATFDMELSHYDILPDIYADKVIAQRKEHLD